MEASIRSKTDICLLSDLESAVKNERADIAVVVAHLAEVDSRQLAIKMGSPSLYAYCTERLKYTEPEAMRRIQAARAAQLRPEVIGALDRGELCLSTLNLIAPRLQKEPALLDEAKGKKKREVEAMLAQRSTEVSKPIDRIRLVKPKAEEVAPTVMELAFLQAPKVEEATARFSETTSDRGRPCPPESKHAQPLPGEVKAARPVGQIQVSFHASEALKAKIEEAKRLLAGKYPAGASLEQVFDEALSTLIEKKTRRPALRKEGAVESLPRPAQSSRPSNQPAIKSRTIPQAIRRAVMERAGERCEYIAPDKTRCASRWDLEVHHLHPYARGGGHTLENLSVRCAAHNAYEARVVFGSKVPGGPLDAPPIICDSSGQERPADQAGSAGLAMASRTSDHTTSSESD